MASASSFFVMRLFYQQRGRRNEGEEEKGGCVCVCMFFSFPEKPDELVTDSGITSLILSIVTP